MIGNESAGVRVLRCAADYKFALDEFKAGRLTLPAYHEAMMALLEAASRLK